MDRVKKTIMVAIASTLAAVSFSSSASLVLGGTRYVYNEDKKEINIKISNPDDNAYIVQSWIEDVNKSKKTPFVITPPIFRLESKQENTARIVFMGAALPKDRESLYWINVKGLPPGIKDGNTLQFAINSRIKLFYRPTGLKIDVKEAPKYITWSKSGDTLTGKNDSPYYINFFELKVNDTTLPEPGMIEPYSTKTYKTNATGKISWKAITDFGGISEQFSNNQ